MSSIDDGTVVPREGQLKAGARTCQDHNWCVFFEMPEGGSFVGPGVLFFWNVMVVRSEMNGSMNGSLAGLARSCCCS